MDTAKIIKDHTGTYLAVYHSLDQAEGRFHVSVATSTELLNWTFRHDFGPGTHQPTIHALADGTQGYVVAWEQDPDNHLSFRYFASRTDLLSGNAARSFDAPQTLSDRAEGTPNIYSVKLRRGIDQSVIDVGAHYFPAKVRHRASQAASSTSGRRRDWIPRRPRGDDAAGRGMIRRGSHVSTSTPVR